MFNKREGLHLVISIFVISIVFGWNDGRTTFNAALWFENFLRIFFMVSIAILVHELGHKIVAKRKDAQTEYELITIEKISFKGKLAKPLPLWTLLALLLTVLSQGKLFFTGIGRTKVWTEPKRRVGRKFPYLTGYEEALILLSGPLANIFLILIVNFFGKVTGNDYTAFANINLLIALWYMVPIPKFDGNGIYFGSRYLYVFGLIFILLTFLLQKLSIFWGTLISLLIAGIATAIYWWKQ